MDLAVTFRRSALPRENTVLLPLQPNEPQDMSTARELLLYTAALYTATRFPSSSRNAIGCSRAQCIEHHSLSTHTHTNESTVADSGLDSVKEVVAYFFNKFFFLLDKSRLERRRRRSSLEVAGKAKRILLFTGVDPFVHRQQTITLI